MLDGAEPGAHGCAQPARGAVLCFPRGAGTHACGAAGGVALPDIATLPAWAEQVPICRACPVTPGCSAASRPELLSLELFACLFIAQVLLKIIGLGQTHLWHCDARGVISVQIFLW